MEGTSGSGSGISRVPGGVLCRTDAGFLCVGKNAVSHPVLKSLPYEHTVESWFREGFPDAEYNCSHATAINIPRADAPGILAIQGAKGLGKSKFIAETLKALPDTTSVLFITFQISLANASLRVLGPHAKMYSEQSGCLLPEAHPRLCVVINSVGRVEPGYEVVIIDELVSVVNAIAGTNLILPRTRTDILVHLHAILEQARCVIVADAMLDARCLRFLLSCCRGVGKPPKPFRLYDYTHRLHSDYTYVAHAYEDTWHDRLKKVLEAGGKVVVACMTVKHVDALKALYGHKYTTLSYTRKDNPETLIAHMRRGVDECWTGCQLLLYSPVITAGCSFERAHFDFAFFYGKCNLAPARTAIQMLARVRDISNKCVHVFISKFDGDSCALGYKPLPEEDDAHSHAHAHAHGSLEEHHLDLLRQLNAFNAREELVCRAAFPYYFWLLAVQSGIGITFEMAESHSYMLPISTTESGGCMSREDVLLATATTARLEKPSAHAWDIRTKKNFDASYAGRLLQRAGSLHLERATALHLLDGITVLKEGMPCSALGFARSRDTRSRSWVVLTAQRALLALAATSAESRCVAIGSPSSVILPRTTVFYDTAAEGADFQPPELRTQACFLNALDSYVDPAEALDTSTSLDATWVIAAADASVRTQDVPVTKTALDLPRPFELDTACVTAVREAVDYAVRTLFDADDVKGLQEAWIGVNVRVGNALATADAVVISRHNLWNVLIFRASGTACNAYDFDVIKGMALLTRIPAPYRRGALVLVYFETSQLVTVDTSRWGAAVSFKHHLDTKTRLCAWDAASCVFFMLFHATGEIDVCYSNESTVVTHGSIEAAFAGVASNKVVSWGFRDGFHNAYTKRVCDLEYVLAAQLPVAEPEVTIAIDSVHPESSPVGAAPTVGVCRLRMLYRSAVKNCALVVFQQDRDPKCLEIYSMPSVAFLTLHRCLDTHTL